MDGTDLISFTKPGIVMNGVPKIKFDNVDEYLSTFPPEVKGLLESLRKAIKQAAPGAEELISYNMPAYKFHGTLVYFAGLKEHIGFYPGNSTTTEVFKNELAAYKTSKGAIQFPAGKALPLRLVKNIVKYRVKENLEIAKAKKKK